LFKGESQWSRIGHALRNVSTPLLAEGADRATFLELAKEVMQLRPFPHQLMHKLAKSHLGPQLSGDQWEL
jgi:hypothetical protein